MTIQYDDLKNDLLGGAPAPAPAPVVTEPAPTPTDPAPVDPTPVDPTPANPAPVDPVVTDPAPADPDPVPPATNPAPTKKADDAAQARAFAAMRVENSKYKAALSKAAEAENLSIDDYLKKLEEQALTTRATSLQTSPEVLRRLDAAESALAAQQDLRIQNHIQAQFGRSEERRVGKECGIPCI